VLAGHGLGDPAALEPLSNWLDPALESNQVEVSTAQPGQPTGSTATTNEPGSSTPAADSTAAATDLAIDAVQGLAAEENAGHPVSNRGAGAGDSNDKTGDSDGQVVWVYVEASFKSTTLPPVEAPEGYDGGEWVPAINNGVKGWRYRIQKDVSVPFEQPAPEPESSASTPTEQGGNDEGETELPGDKETSGGNDDGAGSGSSDPTNETGESTGNPTVPQDDPEEQVSDPPQPKAPFTEAQQSRINRFLRGKNIHPDSPFGQDFKQRLAASGAGVDDFTLQRTLTTGLAQRRHLETIVRGAADLTNAGTPGPGVRGGVWSNIAQTVGDGLETIGGLLDRK